MKVLMVGYHNPNFLNTVVLREKAVGYLGHEVIPFDDSQYLIPGRVRSGIPSVQQWDLNRLNLKLVSLVKEQRPDCCVVVGGKNIFPQTISKIKEMGVPLGLWTTDVPIDFQNILDGAPLYDRLYCAGSEAMDIFHAHGLKAASWLPFGCDLYFHRRIFLNQEEQREHGRDVIFIGSYYPNRAKILEAVADFDLGVWGPYWQNLADRSSLKHKAVNIKMNYDQWVKIFNASKINIVIHYQDGKVPCHQVSPKLFEAMACRCFVLTDRQKDVQVLFKDKEHLVYFNDEQDLRSKIKYYLVHEDERNRIANAGYLEVKNFHTYQHRLKIILDGLSH